MNTPYISFLIASIVMIILVSLKLYYVSDEKKNLSSGELSEASILVPSFLTIIFCLFSSSVIISILHKGYTLGKKIILLISCFLLFLNSIAILINGIILTYGDFGVSGNLKNFKWRSGANYTTTGNISLITGSFGILFSLSFIIFEGSCNNIKIKTKK